MKHKPNLIKLAVTAAGGREAVSKAMGVSVWGVGHWCKSGRVPTEKIRPLCDLGSNVISVDQVLSYIEAQARDDSQEHHADDREGMAA